MKKPCSARSGKDNSFVLSEVLSEERNKEELINKDKISVNYKRIRKIDENIPNGFKNIQKLYLCHNYVDNLENIELFPNLVHLSVAYNHLFDIEELTHVQNRDKIQCLSVKGNFFQKHPNYKKLLINYFPNLKELDGKAITQYMRSIIKDSDELEFKIIPFFFNLQNTLRFFEDNLNKLKIKIELLKQNEHNFTHCDLEAFEKILKQHSHILTTPDFSHNSSTSVRHFSKILSHLWNIDTDLDSLANKISNRKESYEIYKKLFSEIKIFYSIHNNSELEHFLNYEILKNNPSLFEFLVDLIENDDSEIRDQIRTHKDLLEQAVRRMTTEKKLDFDVTTNQQLKYFYLLSPNPSKISKNFCCFDEEENTLLAKPSAIHSKKKVDTNILQQEYLTSERFTSSSRNSEPFRIRQKGTFDILPYQSYEDGEFIGDQKLQEVHVAFDGNEVQLKEQESDQFIASSRFLIKNRILDEKNEEELTLRDEILYKFPLFPFNQFYLKCFLNIIKFKLNSYAQTYNEMERIVAKYRVPYQNEFVKDPLQAIDMNQLQCKETSEFQSFLALDKVNQNVPMGKPPIHELMNMHKKLLEEKLMHEKENESLVQKKQIIIKKKKEKKKFGVSKGNSQQNTKENSIETSNNISREDITLTENDLEKEEKNVEHKNIVDTIQNYQNEMNRKAQKSKHENCEEIVSFREDCDELLEALDMENPSKTLDRENPSNNLNTFQNDNSQNLDQINITSDTLKENPTLFRNSESSLDNILKTRSQVDRERENILEQSRKRIEEIVNTKQFDMACTLSIDPPTSVTKNSEREFHKMRKEKEEIERILKEEAVLQTKKSIKLKILQKMLKPKLQRQGFTKLHKTAQKLKKASERKAAKTAAIEKSVSKLHKTRKEHEISNLQICVSQLKAHKSMQEEKEYIIKTSRDSNAMKKSFNILKGYMKERLNMKYKMRTYYQQLMKSKLFYNWLKYTLGSKEKNRLKSTVFQLIRKRKQRKIFNAWRTTIRELKITFCVKYSDYCRCTSCIRERVRMEINPLFDVHLKSNPNNPPKNQIHEENANPYFSFIDGNYVETMKDHFDIDISKLTQKDRSFSRLISDESCLPKRTMTEFRTMQEYNAFLGTGAQMKKEEPGISKEQEGVCEENKRKGGYLLRMKENSKLNKDLAGILKDNSAAEAYLKLQNYKNSIGNKLNISSKIQNKSEFGGQPSNFSGLYVNEKVGDKSELHGVTMSEKDSGNIGRMNRSAQNNETTLKRRDYSLNHCKTIDFKKESTNEYYRRHYDSSTRDISCSCNLNFTKSSQSFSKYNSNLLNKTLNTCSVCSQPGILVKRQRAKNKKRRSKCSLKNRALPVMPNYLHKTVSFIAKNMS